MATNPYFNFYNHTGEQNLYEDLVVESVRIFAHDMKYLPRTGINFDETLNSYAYSEYNTACDLELYIKNFDSFEGEGQLLSKFGLEVRDQMTLIVTKRSFTEFVQPTTGKSRPEEGDVIFIPMLGTAFQISYVNSSPTFYAFGKLYIWELVCEMYEVTNDQFNTGIVEIDDKYKSYDHADDPDYDLESYDDNAQNQIFQDKSEDVLDFEELDPFGGTV
jgi:hypothetical protein